MQKTIWRTATTKQKGEARKGFFFFGEEEMPTGTFRLKIHTIIYI